MSAQLVVLRLYLDGLAGVAVAHPFVQNGVVANPASMSRRGDLLAPVDLIGRQTAALRRKA
jgi:hypothetical protein